MKRKNPEILMKFSFQMNAKMGKVWLFPFKHVDIANKNYKMGMIIKSETYPIIYCTQYIFVAFVLHFQDSITLSGKKLSMIFSELESSECFLKVQSRERHCGKEGYSYLMWHGTANQLPEDQLIIDRFQCQKKQLPKYKLLPKALFHNNLNCIINVPLSTS